MYKNKAGQKWTVFAFNITTNAPVTGDAANITANLRIDGAAANGVDDTNPTELEDGYYVFDLAQAETNGDNIVICPDSSTADVQVIGCPMAAWTLDLDTADDIVAAMNADPPSVIISSAAISEIAAGVSTAGIAGAVEDGLIAFGD